MNLKLIELTRWNLFFTLLAISTISKAQIGTANHLRENNGFSIIKLGDTITNLKIQTIPQVGYSTPDKYGVSTYFIGDKSILKIGDTFSFVDATMKYLNGRCYSIDLYYEGSLVSITEILKIAYGTPMYQTHDDKSYSASWVSGNVSLLLSYSVYEKRNKITYSDVSRSSIVFNEQQQDLKAAVSRSF